ncbi:MAG: NAD-dependent epimerase/dehydratase family protein [Planctomycetia bacterium]|nr:NAD-dependent epimerase/dehydratase family protein [Planctomycetia bacterium]
MQRIAITGSSGHYGRKLVEHIRRELPNSQILGIDVVPPPPNYVPHEFVTHDIRSSEVQTTLANFRPDTIIHLAFVVNPIRDLKLMHDINVNGTRNVFEAVRFIRPMRFLMASSATAYGAWDDNPLPMDESSPLRPRQNFQYAADKTVIRGPARRSLSGRRSIIISRD